MLELMCQPSMLTAKACSIGSPLCFRRSPTLLGLPVQRASCLNAWRRTGRQTRWQPAQQYPLQEDHPALAAEGRSPVLVDAPARLTRRACVSHPRSTSGCSVLGCRARHRAINERGGSVAIHAQDGRRDRLAGRPLRVRERGIPRQKPGDSSSAPNKARARAEIPGRTDWERVKR